MTTETLDPQFEDKAIESVRPGKDGWELKFDDGWCFWCPDNGIEPKAGDTARLWGGGLGYSVRGIAINGQLVFHQTAYEYAEARQKEQEQRDAERRYDAEQNRAETTARIAALPQPMQDRVNRFCRVRPDFFWENLPYELFVCEQAAAIAERVKADDIKAFHDLDFHQQQVVVPNLDDGHSGNTFGAACRLAFLLHTAPESLIREHGAMCPVVGCKNYGCYSAYPEPVTAAP